MRLSKVLNLRGGGQLPPPNWEECRHQPLERTATPKENRKAPHLIRRLWRSDGSCLESAFANVSRVGGHTGSDVWSTEVEVHAAQKQHQKSWGSIDVTRHCGHVVRARPLQVCPGTEETPEAASCCHPPRRAPGSNSSGGREVPLFSGHKKLFSGYKRLFSGYKAFC